MSTDEVQAKQQSMSHLMGSPTALTAKRKLRRPLTVTTLSSSCHSENLSVSTRSTSRRSKSIVSTPEEEQLFRSISQALAVKSTSTSKTRKLRSINEKEKATLSPIQHNSLHFFDEVTMNNDMGGEEERYFCRGGAMAISKPERVSATTYNHGLSFTSSDQEYEYSTNRETSYSQTFSSDGSVSVGKQPSTTSASAGKEEDQSIYSNISSTELDSTDASSQGLSTRESFLDISSTISEAFTIRMSMLDDMSTDSKILKDYRAAVKFRKTPITRIMTTQNRHGEEQLDCEEVSKLSSNTDNSGSQTEPGQVKKSLFLASSAVAKILSKNEEAFHIEPEESSLFDSIGSSTIEDFHHQHSESSDSSEHTNSDETIDYVPGYRLGQKLLRQLFFSKEVTVQNPEPFQEALLSYSFSKGEYRSTGSSFESSLLSKLSVNDQTVDEENSSHSLNNQDDNYKADDEQEKCDAHVQQLLCENSDTEKDEDYEADDERVESDDLEKLQSENSKINQALENEIDNEKEEIDAVTQILSDNNNIDNTEENEVDNEQNESADHVPKLSHAAEYESNNEQKESASHIPKPTQAAQYESNNEQKESVDRIPTLFEVFSNISDITTLSMAQAYEQSRLMMAYSDQFSTASTCNVPEKEDFEGQQTSFVSRAGRLLSFFGDRLDKDNNELVLVPDDKPALEDVLGNRTCLPFIQALRKHLNMKSEMTKETVERCQFFGLDREGAQNPLFAILALETQSIRFQIPANMNTDATTCELK